MLQSVNERVEQETEYQGMGLFEPRPDLRSSSFIGCSDNITMRLLRSRRVAQLVRPVKTIEREP